MSAAGWPAPSHKRVVPKEDPLKFSTPRLRVWLFIELVECLYFEWTLSIDYVRSIEICVFSALDSDFERFVLNDLRSFDQIKSTGFFFFGAIYSRLFIIQARLYSKKMMCMIILFYKSSTYSF